MRIKQVSGHQVEIRKKRKFNPCYVDAMILYEHRARELENACLLATELSRRGFKVSIEYMNSLGNFLTKPKVIVVPHLYDDYQVCFMAKNIWGEYPRTIIDLQSEQVLSKSADKNEFHKPSGQAKNAQHIAWGEAQVKKYLDDGIPPENIHLTGHIAMDFLRDELSSCFLSKVEIAKKYNLDPNRKWVLFLSSFSLTNRTDENLKEIKKMVPEVKQIYEVTIATREKILEWFEAAVITNPDKLFIYRPHPAENKDPLFLDLEQRYDNFVCIRDFSSRQWVLVSDHLYTWISTSIIDAYFANKPCYILRPVDVPSAFDNPLLENCDHIKKKSTFLDSLGTKENHSEQYLDSEEIEYYYGCPNSGFAYKKIADLCEEAIMHSSYQYNYKFSGHRFSPYSGYDIKGSFKTIAKRCLVSLSIHFRLGNLFSRFQKLQKFQYFEKELYGFNKEASAMVDRLTPFVEKNKDIS